MVAGATAGLAAVLTFGHVADALAATLPAGYRIETGGAVEESAKGQSSVNAGFPLFLGVVFTVLMVQLGSFSRTTS